MSLRKIVRRGMYGNYNVIHFTIFKLIIQYLQIVNSLNFRFLVLKKGTGN